MHGTYLQNKKSVERWKAKNPDKVKQTWKKQACWLKIQRIYLRILL
jgi:hypothetical protein